VAAQKNKKKGCNIGSVTTCRAALLFPSAGVVRDWRILWLSACWLLVAAVMFGMTFFSERRGGSLVPCQACTAARPLL
jgi:hypothetical protein